MYYEIKRGDIPPEFFNRESERCPSRPEKPEDYEEEKTMTDTNPLFDQKITEAGEASMRLVPMEGRDSYLVEIVFPLDCLRVYASKWVNPLRVALEAAEEALNDLKCQVFNQELNGGKPYEKPKEFPVEHPEEKKDG